MSTVEPVTTASSPFAVAATLLVLGVDALAACGAAPLSRVHVAAGVVAWDDCCGTLVAAPERVYRTASFPVEGGDDTGCFDGLIAVDVVVLLLRCLPVVDDRGTPPAPVAVEAAYATLLTDAAVLWDAYSGALPAGWRRANLSQTFGGADGGCISAETRLTVGLDAELWCPCP